MLLSLPLFSCNAQDKSKEANTHKEDQTGEITEPKGRWTVNKEFDEHGNMIKYDSVYSYSFSTINGEQANKKDVDSLIHSFQHFFDSRVPSSWDRSFMRPYWSDSLFMEDFFQEDYFHNRWKEDFFNMEDKFKYMDSLRNQYLRRYYPNRLDDDMNKI